LHYKIKFITFAENNNKMNKLNFSEDNLKMIYEKSYSIAESKGKTRQKTINYVVIDALQKNPLYSGCEFRTDVVFEKDILIWGTFTANVCIYKNEKLIEIVLIKALASNIKQNQNNTMSKTVADIVKLNNINPKVKITVVNFAPNNPPFFTRDEVIKGIESNSVAYLPKSGNKFRYVRDIDEINVTFHIENLESCRTKTDVKNLFKINPIKNVTSVEIAHRK
jgi:hypothetical protein